MKFLMHLFHFYIKRVREILDLQKKNVKKINTAKDKIAGMIEISCESIYP